MSESVEPDRISSSASGRSRWRTAVIAFAAVFLLVALRTWCEHRMMREHGPDAQMGIWLMFMLLKVGFWFVSGSLLTLLALAVWHKRWGPFVTLPPLLIWGAAISVASWKYETARRALADAANPMTPPARLVELVEFEGIQAGYALDNRLAGNPGTPPDALEELSRRDQDGTKQILAGNPNTPEDVLSQLADEGDSYVAQALLRNPDLPDSVRKKLEEHPIERVRRLVVGAGDQN